ncbi:MAG: hypothetical protein ABW130_03045 [Candidatus Thiodiazotropha lotti]
MSDTFNSMEYTPCVNQLICITALKAELTTTRNSSSAIEIKASHQ